jgi:hypothetical protein
MLYILSPIFIADSKCLKLCRPSDEDRAKSCVLDFGEGPHVADAVYRSVLLGVIRNARVLTRSAMLRAHTT